MSYSSLPSAITILKQGGIIAYPTEAVFGFGCDPDNLDALSRLLTIKQRPAEKGLIVIASDWAQLQPFVQPLTATQMQTLMQTWPGPFTWLVPAAESVSALIKGTHTKIAVRITAHPIASELCRQFGKALISTSANRSNQPPCLTATEVSRQFQHEIDYIVVGDTGGQDKPTTICDLISGQILR